MQSSAETLQESDLVIVLEACAKVVDSKARSTGCRTMKTKMEQTAAQTMTTMEPKTSM